MKTTVIPSDKTVTVDGAGYVVALPACDANWHALQFDGATLVIECIAGAPLVIEGADAATIMQPFTDAYNAAAAAAAKAAADLQAKKDADAAALAAALAK